MSGKDSAGNAFIWLGVAFAAVACIIVVGVIVLPGLIVGAIVWGIYKYQTRPKPPISTFDLAVAAESLAFPGEYGFVEDVILNVLARTERGVPLKPIARAMMAVATELYKRADLTTKDPPQTSDELEQARYRDYLRAQRLKLQNVAALQSAVESSLEQFLEHLPSSAFVHDVEALEKTSKYSVPLVETLVDKKTITKIILPFYRAELKDNHLLQTVRDQLDQNMCELSKLPFSGKPH